MTRTKNGTTVPGVEVSDKDHASHYREQGGCEGGTRGLGLDCACQEEVKVSFVLADMGEFFTGIMRGSE